MDGGLDRAHEAGAHINALRAKGDRSSETLAVGEAARGDEGDAEGLAGAGEEDEVCDVGLADVAGAFEAVDGEEVDAEFDGRLGVADGGAFVQDDAAVGFEELDYGAGTVAGGLDDFDAFVDAHLGVFLVGGCIHRGEEGDVYAEGVGGHPFGLADLISEVFWCGLCEGC